MKRALKILKYLVVTFVVILTLLISLSIIFQDQVTRLFIKELNRVITSTIEVKKAKLSLIRSFPWASVELTGVSIKSPLELNISSDSTGLSERNLIDAEFLSASFRIRDLIRKEYSIERITLINSTLFIYTNSLGDINTRIWEQEEKAQKSALSLNLKNIKIEDTRITYFNEKSDLYIDGLLTGTSGKIGVFDNRSDIEIRTDINLASLISDGKSLVSQYLDLDLDGRILISPDTLAFEQCNIKLVKQEFNLSGHILQKRGFLSLDISTPGARVKSIKEVLPGNITDKIEDIIEGGELIANMNISGDFKTEKKIVMAGFAQLKSSQITISEKISPFFINILHSSLSMSFKEPLKEFKIDINSVDFDYSGSNYRGSIKVKDLNRPEIDIILSGHTNFPDLISYTPLPGIKEISGYVHTNLRLTGSIGSLKKFEPKKLLDLKRSVNLNFDNVTVTSDRFNIPFENINGNIMISENMWIDELSFNYAKQNVVLNSKIEGLKNLFNSNNGEVNITAGIWADRFSNSTLQGLTNRNSRDTTRHKNSTLNNISASLTFNIDSLILDNFKSAQVNGTLGYREGLFNIRRFDMLTLGGSLSGNAAIAKNFAGGYLTRGWFDFSNININKTFTVFNNFGQDQLVAENIYGKLTGSLEINATTDKHFKPLIPSLSVAGNYSIVDGELLNFEPLRKLSRFIEISELEDIRFEELKNELAISNGRLIIPSMNINSTAFNISLSGEQSFDGGFEYHLRVLLSEILSKKARKSGSYTTEFGPVEDDGLGKTTLYLKLEKGEDGTSVSYDVKKLSEDIKVDLEQEKQSLKTILNEEYGWYKGDTLKRAEAEKSKKFRITWEEADSISTISEPQRESRLNLFKKLKNRLSNQNVNDTIIKKF